MTRRGLWRQQRDAHNWKYRSPKTAAPTAGDIAHTRQYRKPRRGLALSREARQNADLSLDKMYVVSVLAQAELAFYLRRQEPSIWSFPMWDKNYFEGYIIGY